MSYIRVIPRDLFNEAKLLKSAGRIALLAHDRAVEGLVVELDQDDYNSFDIDQSDDDASLYIRNLWIYGSGGRYAFLHSRYNSKEPYDCFLEISTITHDYCIEPLDREGNPTQDFIKWAKGEL